MIQTAERLMRIAARVELSSHDADGMGPLPTDEARKKAMDLLRTDIFPEKLKTDYDRFKAKYHQTFHQCARSKQRRKIFYIYWFMRTVRNFAEHITRKFHFLLLQFDEMYAFDEENMRLIPQIETQEQLRNDPSRDPIRIRISNLQPDSWNRSGDAFPICEIRKESTAEATRIIPAHVRGMMWDYLQCHRREALTLPDGHAILQHVKEFWASNIFTVDTLGVQKAYARQGNRYFTYIFIRKEVLSKIADVAKEADDMVTGIEQHLVLQGMRSLLDVNENDRFCQQEGMPGDFAPVCNLFQKYNIRLSDACRQRDATPEQIRKRIVSVLQLCMEHVLAPLLRRSPCILMDRVLCRTSPMKDKDGRMRNTIRFTDNHGGADSRLWQTDRGTYASDNTADAWQMVYHAVCNIARRYPDSLMHSVATAFLISCTPEDLVLTSREDREFTCTIAETHVQQCIRDIDATLQVSK
jgi:hypothetical protein